MEMPSIGSRRALPRHEAEGSHCADCSSVLDPWDGQAGARKYAFNARDIGQALNLVAVGSSYRQAAQTTGLMARRGVTGVTWGRRRPRKRICRLDGQLVANWVDVFGPVVCFAHGVSAWPEVLAIDSVEFRQRGRHPQSFHIMAAVGYSSPGYTTPRVWLMRPFASKDQAAWEDFFDLLAGAPQRIVADMDRGIEQAALARFPRRADRPPAFHWSDLHVRRAMENVLAPLRAQPQTHPAWQRYERSLFSVSEWDAFVHAVEQEDANGTALPAALRWVGMYGARIRDQAANRWRRGPYSTGSVGAVNRKLADEFLGTRANRLGNRTRTIKLLDLLTVGLNGQASQRGFAKAVRIYLEGHGGRPQLHQRPHDDPKGAPSLFV
jgi:hypothetical protein